VRNVHTISNPGIIGINISHSQDTAVPFLYN
jgi:hypothetical protein